MKLEQILNETSDEEIIDKVARLWVELGGDAEGIAWTWQKIKKRVDEIIQEG
jgi:hypothetical protein